MYPQKSHPSLRVVWRSFRRLGCLLFQKDVHILRGIVCVCVPAHVCLYRHTGVFCCVVLFFLSHTAAFSHPRPQKNMTSILAPLVSAGYLRPNRGGRGSASRRRGPYEGAGEHLRRRARGVPFRGGVRRFHLVGLHRPAQLVSCVWERDIPQGRPWMRIYRLKQGG